VLHRRLCEGEAAGDPIGRTVGQFTKMQFYYSVTNWRSDIVQHYCFYVAIKVNFLRLIAIVTRNYSSSFIIIIIVFISSLSERTEAYLDNGNT